MYKQLKLSYESIVYSKFRRKWSLMLAVVIMVPVFVSLANELRHNPFQVANWYNYNTIAFAVGNNGGFLFQQLLYWMMPIWIYFIILELFHDNVFSGNIEMLKVRNKNYIRNKIFFDTILLTIGLLLLLLLNYALSYLFFSNGTTFRIISVPAKEDFPIQHFQIMHPTITNFIYIFKASFMFMILSFYMFVISLFEANKTVFLGLIFAVWSFLVLGPYTVISIFQPFTEVSVIYTLKAFILFNMAMLLTLFFVYVRSKCKKS